MKVIPLIKPDSNSRLNGLMADQRDLFLVMQKFRRKDLIEYGTMHNAM